MKRSVDLIIISSLIYELHTGLKSQILMILMIFQVNLSFVVYDSKAQFSDALTIQTTRASGMTNFVDAFLKIEEHMTKLKTSNSQDVNPKLIVFFMTDGEDTVSKPSAINCAKEHLQAEMGKYGAEVIVNVLGFSANHDDRFLESLSLLGTSDGSYQFIGKI